MSSPRSWPPSLNAALMASTIPAGDSDFDQRYVAPLCYVRYASRISPMALTESAITVRPSFRLSSATV
jgi:hypothetical protein